MTSPTDDAGKKNPATDDTEIYHPPAGGRTDERVPDRIPASRADVNRDDLNRDDSVPGARSEVPRRSEAAEGADSALPEPATDAGRTGGTEGDRGVHRSTPATPAAATTEVPVTPDAAAADRRAEEATRAGDRSGTDPVGKSWPGPSAASSVGQAAPVSPVSPAPDSEKAESGTSWAGPTVVAPERGDPSVRENYVSADAERKVGAQVDDADATAPAPVTSITSGRRRSEAKADAVDGRSDVTSDEEWRELQARFVDDPESTVAEAATLIERDLAGLRSKLAGGSTEDLRNAFKRYRGLHESLG
ncbi:chromosomal replication initiator protein DnaA [Kineosporia succinea]|uniref:Uncharacterized protein n=1 Tax=Kineosporia succinea TaxID=84632 RepID=A0ABT9NZR2_9ACTN|nr:hypothetical protein [Kineosporia succinea]MDP9825921.1 hypothetical protein [Kineosporia succinea]